MDGCLSLIASLVPTDAKLGRVPRARRRRGHESILHNANTKCRRGRAEGVSVRCVANSTAAGGSYGWREVTAIARSKQTLGRHGRLNSVRKRAHTLRGREGMRADKERVHRWHMELGDWQGLEHAGPHLPLSFSSRTAMGRVRQR